VKTTKAGCEDAPVEAANIATTANHDNSEDARAHSWDTTTAANIENVSVFFPAFFKLLSPLPFQSLVTPPTTPEKTTGIAAETKTKAKQSSNEAEETRRPTTNTETSEVQEQEEEEEAKPSDTMSSWELKEYTRKRDGYKLKRKLSKQRSKQRKASKLTMQVLAP